MTTIKFINVGRMKKTWEQQIDQEPTEAILDKMLVKSGALMSHDVFCEFDGDKGAVFAGFHKVGDIEIHRA